MMKSKIYNFKAFYSLNLVGFYYQEYMEMHGLEMTV